MSRLEDVNNQFRDSLLSKNRHTKSNMYDVSNPDALSDGDDYGKGENSGSIGGATDIKTRSMLLAKNKFGKGKEYDISNA